MYGNAQRLRGDASKPYTVPCVDGRQRWDHVSRGRANGAAPSCATAPAPAACCMPLPALLAPLIPNPRACHAQLVYVGWPFEVPEAARDYSVAGRWRAPANPHIGALPPVPCTFPDPVALSP